MESLIELQQVTVFSQDFPVLEDVSLSLPRGGNTVIMGPSGCGKSTLLKVAAGVVIPDRGRVILQGRPLDRLPARQLAAFRSTSGFVFQDAALWANKTVYENLALPMEYHLPRSKRRERERRIRQLLEPVQLLGSLELRPAQLSIGEQKMVSFLRAVVLRPEVLFLDEPTTSIDHLLLEKMMEMIRELMDRGSTIVAVTHDPHLASMIAHHLVVLKGGRVLEAGDLASVRRSSNREVIAILSQVLREAATYDTDILDLLEDWGTPPDE